MVNAIPRNEERSAYSNLGYNGPASTFQFLTIAKSLLTGNVTPCIEFADSKIHTELGNIIRPIETQNPKEAISQYLSAPYSIYFGSFMDSVHRTL